MQKISESSVEDLPSRISYLSSFLGLGDEDGEALRASKPLIAPLIPAILEAVYVKLLSFDITAKVFVPKNTDFEGEVVGDVRDLTVDHPQIVMRKDFLKNYLVRLVTTSDLLPSSSFWVYLNNVGVMHTGKPGFKHREKRPDLRVEYIHMGALLGYVIDLVVGAVMEMDAVDTQMKSKVLRAFNKVLWIQNDLFARHYIAEEKSGVEGQVTPPPERDVRGAGGCPFSG